MPMRARTHARARSPVSVFQQPLVKGHTVSDKARLVPSVDGPTMITGDFEIAWPSGHVIEAGNNVSLCRCGASKDKPFCDGSHKTIGFKSREGDDTAHKPK
jgi:CDGSH-type Zn-finger protein